MKTSNTPQGDSKLYVTRKALLGTFAKYAVQQSPYTKPDNLTVVLNKLNDAILDTRPPMDVMEFDNWQAIETFLNTALGNVKEFLAWNDRKNGNDAPMKFTSRYDTDDNPDDDFIDLDALIRNVATEVERGQS